ncbi:MAG: nucleoside-diphosphate kinase [Candidatus Aminicenantales bacterium]
MSEKTLAIIKPDAVKRKVAGKIIDRIENENFRIVEMKMIHLTKDGAKGFYAVHKEKSFFETLTDFMSSGEIVVMVLERENAISHWRLVMGETDPNRAKPETLRKAFGLSIEQNAVHGSDSPQTAEAEIQYFFTK